MTDHPESTDPTVIDLVDQLEELVSTGRRVPFTAGVVINEDEVLELIDRTRLGLPDELMQARHLLEDQRRVVVEAEQEAERILSRAETEVARIVGEAEARAAVMVGDHAIAEQAREHAATVLAEAEERAAKTCSEADAYAREVMLRLEDQLMRAADDGPQRHRCAPHRGWIAAQTPRARVGLRVARDERTAILTAPTGRAAVRARRPRRNRACRFPSKRSQSVAATFGALTTRWKCRRSHHARAAASRGFLTASARTAATIAAAKWSSPSNHRSCWPESHSAFPDRAARPPVWRMG